MKARINLFCAWFLVFLTLGMEQVGGVGAFVLGVLGVTLPEQAVPTFIVGTLLLFGVVFAVQHFYGALPPQGKPEGNGYRFGHRMVLAGNVLAAVMVLFTFTYPLMNRDTVVLLSSFTHVFSYIAVAFWAVGFSFIYQSSLPAE
ncbi:MAG TPA: hypothetical protein VFK88_11580 [Gallionella sp.]|nr:hypothetical protein [Gallionella sp.]